MNALLEISCVYSEIIFTIISFFKKLIKGTWGWKKSGEAGKSEGLENFQELESSERGAIFQYSRVTV